MKTLLYTGSFDPVTLGHMNIIRRAAKLCDRLVIGVLYNPAKHGVFTAEERGHMLEKACADIPNVQVVLHTGMAVQCAAEVYADAIVRGVRPLGDFENEFGMAQLNRRLGGIETLLLPTQEEFAVISSSAVREIAAFGGSIHGMVPDELEEEVLAALRR